MQRAPLTMIYCSECGLFRAVLIMKSVLAFLRSAGRSCPGANFRWGIEVDRPGGFGDGRALTMSSLAGALQTSARSKMVYNQSHDDCGNREGSARTSVIAVNFAPVVGETRARPMQDPGAAAMTLLSAGTPMFFMGKEIGAQKPCRYNDFLENRESILGEADGNGAGMISCYRDLIAVSVGEAAIRSRNIAIPLVHDENRVIAFHRWNNSEDFLVVGSLNDAPLMTATGCTANAWEMTFGRRSSIPMHANMAAGTSAIAAKRSEPRQERSMSSAGVRRAGLSQAIAGGGCGQAKPSGSLSSFLSAP